RTLFQRMAGLQQGQLAADMAAVAATTLDTAAIRRLSNVSPLYNAQLRTTCVATELSGGHAENALPQTATATVNCRMLPGTPSDEVQATLTRVVADTAVKRSEEHTSELQSRGQLVCRLLLETKKYSL